MATHPVSRLKRWFPVTLPIDGRDIRLQITRFDVRQANHFDRLFDRAVADRADHLLLIRKPGDEMDRHQVTALSSEGRQKLQEIVSDLKQRQAAPTEEKPIPTGDELLSALDLLAAALKPTDEFVIPDSEIRTRRFAEFEAAGRARYDALLQEDQAAFDLFVVEALGTYVRVEPGQLELEDDEGKIRDVRTGADLMQCYGGRPGFISELVKRIRFENRLSDELKNVFRSRSASATSSLPSDRDRTPSGPSPAATAPNVAPEGSVTNAVATASSEGPSSGGIATTN